MKSVAEMFKESAEMVQDQFGTADASEQLRASLALVELTMRATVEESNQRRWEKQMALPSLGQEQYATAR